MLKERKKILCMSDSVWKQGTPGSRGPESWSAGCGFGSCHQLSFQKEEGQRSFWETEKFRSHQEEQNPVLPPSSAREQITNYGNQVRPTLCCQSISRKKLLCWLHGTTNPLIRQGRWLRVHYEPCTVLTQLHELLLFQEVGTTSDPIAQIEPYIHSCIQPFSS